jgi:hypothetical protein
MGSGVDPRAVRIDTVDGSITLARVSGDRFGLPNVDRMVERYGEKLVWG